MIFPRLEVPELDPDNDNVEFQAMDWYIAENDPAIKHYNSLEQKWSHFINYEIIAYGCTIEGNSITARITNFEPYFYVKLPDEYQNVNKNKRKEIVDNLKKKLLTEKITKRKRNGDTYETFIIPYAMREQLVNVESRMNKTVWGFTNDQTFAFAKITVKTLSLFNILKGYFEYNEKSWKLYESNIDPMLRFFHKKEIQPGGWIKIKKGSYHLYEYEEPPESSDGSSDECNKRSYKPPEPTILDTSSRTSYNIVVDYKDVSYMDSKKNAPILIAGWDIECDSSHGDFPMSKKNYRKLTIDIVDINKANMLDDENLKAWISQAFHSEVNIASNLKIHRLYTKAKIEKDYMVSDSIINKIRDIISNESVDTCIDVLNAFLTSNLPALNGDAIIQIGTTVSRFGSDEIIYQHLISLKDCADIEDADVECYKTEKEVLMAWRDFLQKLDPDAILGYNIYGFDMKYVWERAEELGIIDEFAVGLGRLSNRKTIMECKRLSSSALGDNIMYCINLDGIVVVDLLKVMQRDEKLDSYKLDAVASIFLNDNKEDLKPQEIFKKYRGNAEDRKIIGVYCLKDCSLLNRLFHKRKIHGNTLGMCNVCLVPIMYIYMRGQSIKIFSLFAYECRKDGKLIPVVKAKKSGADDEESEEGYEGAIVLEPQTGMYLDDPTIVFDYSSLYPSSMIARDLSHDRIVIDEKYANIEGVKYITVEYDEFQGKGDKKVSVGKKKCVYAQPDEKGVVSKTLQKLLRMRKICRKMIEYQTVYLNNGEIVSGTVSFNKDEKMHIIKDEETNEVRKIPESDVDNTKEITETFDKNEQAVLDARQLAYKVTANSLYGQIGSSVSPIHLKEIAASTTATGREMIMVAKGFMEEKYGAEIIYGDSVMAYTPILLKNKKTGEIFTKTISDISNEIWKPYDVFKAGDSNRKEKQQIEIEEYETWTDNGWSNIKRVIRHKCNKSIYRILTHTGLVDVTEDHSLLSEDKQIIKPTEVKIGTKLLYGFPQIINNQNIINDYIIKFKTQLDAQQYFMQIYKKKNLRDFDISFDYTNGEYIIICKKSNDIIENEIKKIEKLYESYESYVYDLETETGNFQAGIGNIIVKNTDSIFCKFPLYDNDGNKLNGREALRKAIAVGQEASKEICKILPPPQSLAYEKCLWIFVLLSKKRYFGDLYENDADAKPKLKTMGIVLKRRDNAQIVKHIYGGIVDILRNTKDLNQTIEFFRREMQVLVDGKTPLKDLVITKLLKDNYKDPTKIAHKVLAERMGDRDPGNKPLVNDRVPFVYILPENDENGEAIEAKLQGDRIEHPEYIIEKNLIPDYKFYITNQLMNPITQMFSLVIDKLPGYSFPPEYWIQMEEELSGLPIYMGNTEDKIKKRQEKVEAMKMKEVENLLFDEFLRQLPGYNIKKKRVIVEKTEEEKTARKEKIKKIADTKYLMEVTAKEITRMKEYECNIDLISKSTEENKKKKDKDENPNIIWNFNKQIKQSKIETIIACLAYALMEKQDMHEEFINAGLTIKVERAFVKLLEETIEKGDKVLEEYSKPMNKKVNDVGAIKEINKMRSLVPIIKIHSKLGFMLKAT